MRQVPRPAGLPAAYTPGASSNSALTLRVMSQTLSASPSSAYTPSRVPANACAGPPRTSASTGGRSTRQPLTRRAIGQDGFPRLSSHALRVGSSRYSPRSVPTQTRLPVSGASARTRLTHPAPGGGHRAGVGYSVQVRPPSVERASPRRWPAHTLPSEPRVSASTYRLRSRPHGYGVAPRDDAVGRDVLPRGAELFELPVRPGLAAVGRQAPPVPHGAVPDLGPRAEPEGVHEVEGNRPGGGVARVLQLLPAPGSLPEHEDPLAVGTDPHRLVGRASDREHVDTKAGRVREGGERLGA